MGSGIGGILAKVLPMAAGLALTPFIGPAGPVAGTIAQTGVDAATAATAAAATPGLVSGIGNAVGSTLTQAKQGMPSLPSQAPLSQVPPSVGSAPPESPAGGFATFNPNAASYSSNQGNDIASNLLSQNNPFALYAAA